MLRSRPILLLGLVCLAAVRAASAQTIVPADYRWRAPFDNAGGHCNGFYLHPKDAEVRYVQSGDTGAVRWDAKEARWLNFTDWNANVDFDHVAGIALDPKNPDAVYYAVGHPKGEIFKSTDRAKTFTAAKLAKPDGKPVYINGGEDASTSADCLVVDPNNANVLFFASRLDGLWRSDRASEPGSWKKVETFTARGDVAPTFQADGKPDRKLNDRGGLTFVAIERWRPYVEMARREARRRDLRAARGGWRSRRRCRRTNTRSVSIATPAAKPRTRTSPRWNSTRAAVRGSPREG